MSASLDGWQALFLEVAVAALAPPSLCRSLGFIQSRAEAPEARVPRYVFLFIYVRLFLSCIKIDNGHGKLYLIIVTRYCIDKQRLFWGFLCNFLLFKFICTVSFNKRKNHLLIDIY